MLSSCQADTENQPKTTIVNNGSDSVVTPEISGLTIRQMCRKAPATFQMGWPSSKPSFTLEQWFSRQPVMQYRESA